MLLRAIAFAGLLVAAPALFAQPHISYRGIVNAASYTPAYLPSGGIARGSIFSIFGSGLGPGTLATVAAFPVPTTLAGVSIKVTQGATSVDALPLAVGAGQINAVMPSNAPLGRVSVQVTYNGVKSNYSPTVVSASTFGIFTANGGGFGPGILQTYLAADKQPINSLQTPAKPGDVLTLWGTGLGAINNDAQQPTPTNLDTPVEVFVAGKPAAISYAGRSSCCAGVDQIVLQLPADTPTGCWIPVQVRTAGANVSNAVTIAVSADRSACTEPKNPLAATYISGGKVATAAAIRHVVHNDLDFATSTDTTTDSTIISIGSENGGLFAFNRALSLPPPGACTTYSMPGGITDSSSLGFFGAVLPSGASLDAGQNITLQTSGGLLAIPHFPLLPYGAPLGTVFTPGQPVNFSAPGGADIGAFQVSLTAAAPLSWTNQSDISVIDRTAALPLTWTPQSGSAYIVGTNYDIPTNASTSFVCTADAASGAFTIPAYILGALPQSRGVRFRSAGFLMLGYSPDPVPFTAPNLTTGFARFLAWSDKKVLFQ